MSSVDHDIVGENFLKQHGFPEKVTSFVRGHVQVSMEHKKYKSFKRYLKAKRYLVYKNPGYHDTLSEASKGKNGLMTIKYILFSD